MNRWTRALKGLLYLLNGGDGWGIVIEEERGTVPRR